MTGLSQSERATLLELARAAIEDRVREPGRLARTQAAARISPALRALRGAFVSLHEPSRLRSAAPAKLRGCIGTVEPHEPLFQCVIHNAADAAFQDPRFPAVTSQELADLRIEISALHPLRNVAGPEEILVGRDGVELRNGSFHSVFLPQVAVEQGWDVARLLEQLARKAGLRADGWRAANLRIFQAEVFGEVSD